jgi:hypothetical protein
VTRFVLDSRVLGGDLQNGTFAKDCGELEALVGWMVDLRVHTIYVRQAVPANDPRLVTDRHGTFQLNTRLVTDRAVRK